jgi:hypothetical protein
MALFSHMLFTINLHKVIAVFQNEAEDAVTIQTDDLRKIEVTTNTPEEAMSLLGEIAIAWETSVGPLLRYGKHVFLTSAIYSIQAAGPEVYIFFRDHSVSFTMADAEQATDLLSELTARWKEALLEDHRQEPG